MGVLLVAAAMAAVLPAAGSPQLHDLRAARRAQVRAAALDKAAGGGSFGLLVIPVAFADASFDPSGDPDQARSSVDRLTDYVTFASQGRTVLAPQVMATATLPGDRSDYSDIGRQGYERSRAMALLALEIVAARDVDLSACDQDGDGEVDGVLLLHAGPGLENDPDGFIEPLQYFLDEPVVQRGTVARVYAVASALSTVGIVAHETAHLLGLEDRYDPYISSSAEQGPAGGLGMFSLMSGGWLGTGAGDDPSLPDAYSRLQLGWVDLAPEPALGAVVRLRQEGPAGPEYFLAEMRSPAARPPYDAALPAQRLLVYHVDERLADGERSAPDWPERHLRVELTEADGGREVARGESQGQESDLFPAQGVSQTFSSATIPGSWTWDGDATGVAFQVEVVAGELVFADRGTGLWGDLRLVAGDSDGSPDLTCVLRFATETDLPPTVTFELEVIDATWGRFETGDLAFGDLVRVGGGAWHQYAGPPLRWVPASGVPAGATTVFSYRLAGGAQGSGELTHVWDPTWSDLDLGGAWPGAWTAATPGGNFATVWHRWLAGSAPGLPAVPILAATGAAYSQADSWPDVSYGNDAHARLLTPYLGTAVRWVELTHALDIEVLYPGRAVDGATFTWVHDSGYTAAAEPVDGWRGIVDPRSPHALAGAATFADIDPLDMDLRPLWRREILAVPDASLHGPGPWRLQFDLASNDLWRARGWLIRDLVGHEDQPPTSAFPISVSGSALAWTWPGDGGAVRFAIETSVDGGATWTVVREVDVPADSGPDHEVARSVLGETPGVRTTARVVAVTEDRLASPALAIAELGTPALGLPTPNPATTICRLGVDADGDPEAEVTVHDLRGRLVRRWRPGAAPTSITWDGTDDAGRRVAAGVYIFRLRAQGRNLNRKATWLR